MIKLFVRCFKPAPRVTPTKVAALKVFCLVRRAQRSVTRIPSHGRSMLRDVSDAWRESGRIVPE